jgi:hypothetical protein
MARQLVEDIFLHTWGECITEGCDFEDESGEEYYGT